MRSIKWLGVEDADERVQLRQCILAVTMRLAARRVDDGQPADISGWQREARQRIAVITERLDAAKLRPVVLDRRVRAAGVARVRGGAFERKVVVVVSATNQWGRRIRGDDGDVEQRAEPDGVT